MALILDGQERESIVRAAAALRQGQLVAFPTETVYGLGADGLSGAAVERIFAAKGRPADNPVILHVTDFAAACRVWQASAAQLARARACAEAFWPGPLTIVLPAATEVPPAVRAGLPTVAVRVPAHPVAQALLQEAQIPLAAPSANRSGRPSPTRADHVLRTLSEGIAVILDGGPTAVGIESTVLDLSSKEPRILRPGMVGRAEIAALLPEVRDLEAAEPQSILASPGLRHRHYAPAIERVAIADESAFEHRWHGDEVFLMRVSTFRRLERTLGPRACPVVMLPDDVEGFARALFDTLYRLEHARTSALALEALPGEGRWAGVCDRIRRAAGK